MPGLCTVHCSLNPRTVGTMGTMRTMRIVRIVRIKRIVRTNENHENRENREREWSGVRIVSGSGVRMEWNTVYCIGLLLARCCCGGRKKMRGK